MNINIKEGIYYLLLLFVFDIQIGCLNISPNESIPSAVNNSIITKTGLKREITQRNYLFELCYKPASLMAMQELKNVTYTENQFDSVRDGFNEMYYFTFSMRPINDNEDIVKRLSNDNKNTDSIISYLAFKMQNDFMLVRSDNDTLNCKLFHFERDYGSSPYLRFDLAFDKDPRYTKSSRFIYEDKILKTGPVEFSINNLYGDIALSEIVKKN